jgi:predicted membrane-bound spermidine synthase
MFLGLRLVVVPAFATHGVFFAAAFAAAFLVGSQFALAASLLRTGAVSAASDLYGLDLLGSAIGAIAVSVVLIPLLGILEVCVVLGVLSLLAAAVSSLGRKKYLGSGC